MKNIYLILFLFLPFFVPAQTEPTRHDTLILDQFFNFVGRQIKKTFKKSPADSIRIAELSNIRKQLNNFSIGFAVQHSSNFNKDYWPLDTNFRMGLATSTSIRAGALVGRTKIYQLGFRAGINYEYFLTKNISIESGILINQSRQKIEYSENIEERTIANNYNLLHSLPLDTLKRSKYITTAFEIPFYIGYTNHRFSVYFGAIVSLVNYNKGIYTFMGNYINKTHYYEYIFGRGQDVQDIVHLSLKIKYLLTNRKYPILLFFATERRDYENFFQLGIQIKKLAY